MKTMETTIVKVLEKMGFPDAQIALGFVTDAEMRELHEVHFGDPSSTNVISFEYEADKTAHDLLLGEVLVCGDVARQEAELANEDFGYRLAQLAVHGTLHVLGYEHVNVDEPTRLEMERLEDDFNPMIREVLGQA